MELDTSFSACPARQQLFVALTGERYAALQLMFGFDTARVCTMVRQWLWVCGLLAEELEAISVEEVQQEAPWDK